MQFPVDTVTGQVKIPGGTNSVREWVKAEDSKEGTCFLEGVAHRDLVFYHHHLPRGHILRPVRSDGSFGEGQIIEPFRRIAVFRRGRK